MIDVYCNGSSDTAAIRIKDGWLTLCTGGRILECGDIDIDVRVDDVLQALRGAGVLDEVDNPWCVTDAVWKPDTLPAWSGMKAGSVGVSRVSTRTRCTVGGLYATRPGRYAGAG